MMGVVQNMDNKFNRLSTNLGVALKIDDILGESSPSIYNKEGSMTIDGKRSLVI